MTSLIEQVGAIVFDAYGTLFDVESAARVMSTDLNGQQDALSALWRSKQLEYSWLCSLSGNYRDFHEITHCALEFALESLGLLRGDIHERLMSRYETLELIPNTVSILRRLNASGQRLAILSNGTRTMLDTVLAGGGIENMFDEVISADDVKTFKPHPAAYGLASARLKLASEDIMFVSSNGWDAYGAKAYGYRVAWCNRSAQVAERLAYAPDITINSLTELPAHLT